MSGSALFDTFARAPLAFEQGEGSWLVAANGERYLDFGAGIAVNSLGPAHPHLVAALTEQAGKLWHPSNLYRDPRPGRGSPSGWSTRRFADQVFFANSGAEANECAIKTARRYHYVAGQPERFRIITFEGAFHGRTLATIAAGGQAEISRWLRPQGRRLRPGAVRRHRRSSRRLIAPETAAIMIEPIQGEGGIRAVPERRRCAPARALRQAGPAARSSTRSSAASAAPASCSPMNGPASTPDIMAVAKGIGGGFPMGACLATEAAATGMTPGMHGTTFGGNPLAMAVGNAVLDVVLADGFLDRCEPQRRCCLKQRLAAIVDEPSRRLRRIPRRGAADRRHARRRTPTFNAAPANQKLLAVPAGDNVIRLLPPLTVTDAEIGEALDRIARGR